MAITHEDIQKAKRISRAIQEYLEMSNTEGIRSTDIYPYLAKKGLIEKDQHNGIHLRRFLIKLKNHNLLNLIPQCTCNPGINNEFNEWHFYKSKSTPNLLRSASEVLQEATLVLVPALTDSEINEAIMGEKSKIELLPKRRDMNFTPVELETRANYPRAYEYWSDKEYEIMISAYKRFKKIDKVAELLDRQPSVVERKLREGGIMS
jgi:hypothetical protein